MMSKLDGFDKAFIAFWGTALIVNLVIWGILIWGFIELVQWLTSK